MRVGTNGIRHDTNGDGYLTVDEMRLSDETDGNGEFFRGDGRG